MTPEGRKLLLEAEDVFLRAAREHVAINQALNVASTEGMELDQAALLAVPYLLNEIRVLRDITKHTLKLTTPFVVRKEDIPELPHLAPDQEH